MDIPDKQIEQIKELVCSLRYGTVSIIVQDGKIVQLEKHEKIRLDK